MREKVAILITAMAVFTLLSDFTLQAKRKGNIVSLVFASEKSILLYTRKRLARNKKKVVYFIL